MRRLILVAVVLAAAVLIPSSEARRPRGPVVQQMVVYANGHAKAARVRARAIHVRVHHDRCAVGRGTPLAALVLFHPGSIGLKDFGSCSSNADDAAGLFVKRIRSDSNHGQSGWVYKVGAKLGTAGAADPSGPFGHGRLRSRQRVVWFYCRLQSGTCQLTLALRVRDDGGGVVSVRVLSYDDEGHKGLVAGAAVRVGPLTGTSSADGLARFTGLAPGRYRVKALKPGLIRTYPQRVTVH
jgi:hypothetical protein